MCPPLPRPRPCQAPAPLFLTEPVPQSLIRSWPTRYASDGWPLPNTGLPQLWISIFLTVWYISYHHWKLLWLWHLLSVLHFQVPHLSKILTMSFQEYPARCKSIQASLLLVHLHTYLHIIGIIICITMCNTRVLAKWIERPWPEDIVITTELQFSSSVFDMHFQHWLKLFKYSYPKV